MNGAGGFGDPIRRSPASAHTAKRPISVFHDREGVMNNRKMVAHTSQEAIPILGFESIVDLIFRDIRAEQEQAPVTKWVFDARNASVEDWDRLMKSGIPLVKAA